VIQDYRGNLILAFAAYNAGRGRVKEWIERYGIHAIHAPTRSMGRAHSVSGDATIARDGEYQVYRARFANNAKPPSKPISGGAASQQTTTGADVVIAATKGP
jgi:hypothetical protein